MGLSRTDSMSSAGSGKSGLSGASNANSQVGADGLGGRPQDGFDQTHIIQTGLFGLLYTYFKERWENNKRYVIGRVVLEHLQVLLILLQPFFLWELNYDHWLWNICNYSLLKILVIPKGYGAYTSVMYVLLGVVLSTWVGALYVSYTFVKNGFVPDKWPIKILRLMLSLTYQVFYVCILNYFLAALNCQYLSTDATFKYHMLDFPGKMCFSMPHITHGAVAAVMALLVIIMAGLISLGDATPNPVSQHWMCAAHSQVEQKAFLFKTVIVLSANLLSGHWQAQASIILVAAGWLAYVYVRWEPHYNEHMNHMRAAIYSMTAWVALILLILVWSEEYLPGKREELMWRLWDGYVPDPRHVMLTTLAFAMFPAVLMLGYAASYWRYRWSTQRVLAAFKGVDAATHPQQLKQVYRFPDEWEAELAARVCRTWVDFYEKELDPKAVAMAETIIKSGLARFNHSSYMAIVHANFVLEVQGNHQTGHSQLQAAKKLNPSWGTQYIIFLREQQHMARIQTQGARTDSAVDLLGYVDFQRNFKMVLRTHKSALFAVRNFWKELLHNNVTYNNLVHAFHHIESCRQRADRTYKMVLERYPTNVKVVRSYARFLEDVKNDPWAASHYYSEADKLEEAEQTAANDTLFLDEADGSATAMLKQVDEKNNAVAVINAQGIIQMANKVLLKQFGYKKGELEGKNISMLMPNPFSQRHNSYLRNYLTTGKAKILDSVRQVMGLHKERYVFPISIAVTRVSGSGTDSIFMGVIKPAVDDPDTVRAWMMPGGNMLCVDLRFTDWFGKTPADCVGKPLSSLAVDPEKMQLLMTMAANGFDEMTEIKNVALSHKYAEPINVDFKIELGGTESQHIQVIVIKKHDSGTEHVMVTDHKGCIIYVTSQLATLLGYTVKQMHRMDFSRFMAQPFSQLHAKWMKDMPAKVPICSCRKGAPVVLITANRAQIPAKLEISTREQGDENIYIVKMKPVTFPVALNDRRVSLHIDARGVVLDISNTPQSTFGFKPSILVGRNLHDIIDVFHNLPVIGGADGMDMEHVVNAMVHKVLEHKDISWRCGIHPPITAAEFAAVKSNAVLANSLMNKTKASVMQMEVTEADDDHGGGAASIMLHVWRSEMLSGVVEVDRDNVIQKAGCCPLHQAGIIFGIPSSALLHTTLSKWVNVPAKYEGMLIDDQRKGALKKSAADVKIGPLRHCQGRHQDGDAVNCTVQAVVKEGAAAGRLLVKLTIDKPKKGNPGLARQLLGLSHSTSNVSALLNKQDMMDDDEEAMDDEPGSRRHSLAVRQGAGLVSDGSGGAALAQVAAQKARGGVKFHADDNKEDDSEHDDAGSDGSSKDDAASPSGKRRPGAAALPGTRKLTAQQSRTLEWVRQASFIAETDITEDDGASTVHGGAADTIAPPPDAIGVGYGVPPDLGVADDASAKSGGEDEASFQEGSEAGGYTSDFKRGKRLRKLAHMLNSRRAQAAHSRFYRHAVLVVLGLMAAHLACFATSVVMIDNQRLFITEVDGANTALNYMHRSAIKCLVMDAQYRGRGHPNLFTPDQKALFQDLLKIDLDKFEANHLLTYLGHNGLRRFENTAMYPLRDYWETDYWNVSVLHDNTPPQKVSQMQGLWEIGNKIIAAARDIQYNHASLAANQNLSDTRQWQYILDNQPFNLYNGYKLTLAGLMERALLSIAQLNRILLILLAVEGCALFLAAAVYIWYLMRQVVVQRYNVFSIFLVIPTGFLRALASKQIQLDEDNDSDEESDMGDAGQPTQEEQQADDKSKIQFEGKKAKGSMLEVFVDASGAGHMTAGAPLWQRVWYRMNPANWLTTTQHLDTGKKSLVRDSRDTLYMVAPFIFWGGVVMMIYAITYSEMNKVQGPFQMLTMISQLVFRLMRGVMFSLNLCIQTTDAGKAIAKAQLAICNADLIKDYNTFLYGTQILGAAVAGLTPLEPAIFQDAQLADIFFRQTGCMRIDQSGCFPSTHKFYDVTHHGVDVMTVRFIEEQQLLLADAAADINLASPRMEYIWIIGRFDLSDGMLLAQHTYRASVSAIFDRIRMGHIIVFVMSMLGGILVMLGMFRPYLRQAGKETRQIAEMLSQLPPEMDVEGLIRQALAYAQAEEDAVDDAVGSHKLSGTATAAAGSAARGGLQAVRNIDGPRPKPGQNHRDDGDETSDSDMSMMD